MSRPNVYGRHGVINQPLKIVVNQHFYKLKFLVVSFLEYEFRSNLTDVTVTSPAAESCVLLR